MIFYCLNSNNCQNLNIRKIPIEYYPNLIKNCKEILDLMQKYCLKKQNQYATRMVLDFIQDAPDIWFFLQIKDLKLGELKEYKNKLILYSRRIMELGPINQCESFFCNKRFEKEISLLEKTMKFKQILNKKFNKMGINLRKENLIIYYKNELDELERCFNNFYNTKNVGTQGKMQNQVHVFQPFLNINLIQQRSKYSKNENINSTRSQLNLKLIHTCDLCKRILELYKNKLTIINDSNKVLLMQLKKLSDKSIFQFDFIDRKSVV